MEILQILQWVGIGGVLAEGARFFLLKKQRREDTRKSHADWIKSEDETYQARIKFYKQVIEEHEKELEEQKEIIESFRHKHPGNGEELDLWKAREQKLFEDKYQLEQKIFELTGHLNFALKEAERFRILYEQSNGMYGKNKNKNTL